MLCEEISGLAGEVLLLGMLKRSATEYLLKCIEINDAFWNVLAFEMYWFLLPSGYRKILNLGSVLSLAIP